MIINHKNMSGIKISVQRCCKHPVPEQKCYTVRGLQATLISQASLAEQKERRRKTKPN